MPEVLTQVKDGDSIEKLKADQLRELDAAIAEKIEPRMELVDCEGRMHDYVSPKGAWVHTHIWEHMDECEIVPRAFSSDISLAMKVEDQIAKLGYQSEYYRALVDVVATAIKDRLFHHFDVVHATPEQRCLAALKALESRK